MIGKRRLQAVREITGRRPRLIDHHVALFEQLVEIGHERRDLARIDALEPSPRQRVQRRQTRADLAD